MPREAEDRDRNEDGCAAKVGGHHRPAPVEPVGDEPAVEAECEGGDAVREPDRDHAERAAGRQGEPHQRDVLEGVAELARGNREVHAAEIAPAQEAERPFRGFGRPRDRLEA
jgi:hypothetical protein